MIPENQGDISDSFLYGLYTEKDLNFGEFPNYMDKYLPEGDAQALVELLGRMPDGAMILELGGFTGRSTAVLASRANVYVVRDLADEIVTLRDNLVKLGLWSRVHLLAMESEAAARIFSDNFLDMVFMNGGRSYASVRSDLMQWTSKIKKGGILCGHGCSGYYSQYTDAIRGGIDSSLESDRPAWDVGGSHLKNIGYPGLIKALHDGLQENFSIFPDSSIWYAGKV